MGDLLQPDTLHAALDEIDTVVHLAASVPGFGSAGEPARVNVDGTRNLVRVVRERRVHTLIHVSSAGVYGDGRTERPHEETDPVAPRTGYEIAKLEAERVLTQELAGAGIRWLVLRPTGVHGATRPATVSFYRTIRRKRLWVHGPVKVIVHPTYISDIVQAILLALDRGDLAGEVINIGGERALLYTSLIAMVAARLNPSLRQFELPSGPTNLGASLIERGLGAMHIGVPNLVERWSHPLANRAVDITKARTLLGFHPADLESSIGETIDAIGRSLS